MVDIQACQVTLPDPASSGCSPTTDKFAALAVGGSRQLGLRGVAGSRRRLNRQCGNMDDRYRGDCSHPARLGQSLSSQVAAECRLPEGLNARAQPIEALLPSS